MSRSRPAGLAGGLLVGLVATVLTVGAAEGLLRALYAVRTSQVEAVALPHAIGDRHGPVPPWAGELRLLEPDPVLLWRNRPAVQRRYVDVFAPARDEAERRALHRRFRPGLPPELAGRPTWEVVLNSRGFRAPEFEGARPPGRIRVVCLGDSWTFGAGVDQDQAYPQQLEARLRRAFPAADVEVLNLGVMGHSSFQGREVLRRIALPLRPDAVLIGYGMNDSSVAGYRDAEVAAARPALRWSDWLAGAAGRSEVFRLLGYLALSLRHRPPSPEAAIREADARAAGRASAVDLYGALEAWTRVPLADYERNLADMVALARSGGAAVVLLFNELWPDNPYRAVAARVAARHGVPLVDAPDLLARARQRLEADLERRLGLTATPGGGSADGGAGGGEAEVVFRVQAGDHPVPVTLSIVGAHPALGDLVPNRVRMRDDGREGDQRAGDGVWSYAARLAPGLRLSYLYTNSGRPGRWEGLDVPALRTVTVDGPGGRRRYRPIERFGSLLLQADAWHTDAAGYALISETAFTALTRDPGLARRLGPARPRATRRL